MNNHTGAYVSKTKDNVKEKGKQFYWPPTILMRQFGKTCVNIVQASSKLNRRQFI